MSEVLSGMRRITDIGVSRNFTLANVLYLPHVSGMHWST